MKKSNGKKIVALCGALAVLSLSICLVAARGASLKLAESERPNAAFELDSPITIENMEGETTPRHSTIEVSRAQEVEEGVVSLAKTGILFNRDPINTLKSISISFAESSFTAATLYYGDRLYPTANSVTLGANNEIDLTGGNYSFFVVRADADDTVISHISVSYYCDLAYEETELPRVYIDTHDGEGKALTINSRVNYTQSKVSVVYPDGEFKNLDSVPAGVRIRGNSTATKPKRPYRIKFDKKQSLFGLTKNKSWALLADYMDASKMKNYTAFQFAHLVRNVNEFTAHPHHVDVYLNDVYQGLYLLTENIDVKEGRLGLEQEDGYFTSLFDEENNFDLGDFPICFERDKSATGDPKSILNETYFETTLSNGQTKYYSLEYPEKSDFVSLDPEGKVIVDENGEAVIDEGKYYLFFNAWKEYVIGIDEAFLSLGQESSLEQIASLADVESFATYGLVDLFMREVDHSNKSAKFYKPVGGLLKAGPSWDYDSCTIGIDYTGDPVENLNHQTGFNVANYHQTFGDYWSKAIYDNSIGKTNCINAWLAIKGGLPEFKSSIQDEMRLIAPSVYNDNALWYSNGSMVFDNLAYLSEWIDNRLTAMERWLG